MTPFSQGDIFNGHAEPHYTVKVRENMFLWGSAGIVKNMVFERPLVLHIRNDVFGEMITIGVQTALGEKETFGTLAPGEAFTIPIHEISGVFAYCQQESIVSCFIRW